MGFDTILHYVGDHVFDIIHVVANVVVVTWALLRQADRIVVNHINSELNKVFMTKEDGQRLEKKLDLALTRVKHVRQRVKEIVHSKLQ